jgi:hypothetical protein
MAFLLPIIGFFGAALGSHVLGKAGISVPDTNANLLTIPINSNELPSGLIGDACNHERKTHNEAKAQKEMRENEARQAREDENIQREINKEKNKKEKEELILKYKKNIKDGEAKEFEKEEVELHEVKVLYDSEKISWSEYFDKCRNIRDRYIKNSDCNARWHMIFKLKDLNREGKITHENYVKFRELIEYGNYLKSKKNIKDGKFAEYEKEFVEHHELRVLYNYDKISQVEYYEKRKNIDDKYKEKICQNEYYKETIIQTPVVKSSTLSSLPKTTESINTYQKISTEAYSQYKAGKMTASEFLKVNNNADEVYEKYGHLTLTSTQFSNQVYIKIAEDAGNQYKAGKLKPGEYAKICNDAKTKYYTEPVKQSTPVPTQPNSTLNNIGNGYVASAQARVNAVNQVASVVSSGATAVGNAYIQGANNIGNYNRMEAQATQQLVSNVASAVGNGASAVGNGFVNPSANSERTNQVLNMVSNAPSAVDLCLSNPRGIGINIVTGMLAEVNNSYNERSTTRNMVNGTIGAVGLVAGVVGAPTIATAIGGTALAVEYAEFANNIDTLINENTLPEHRPITRGLLSD